MPGQTEEMQRHSPNTFATSALERGWWSAPSSLRFTSWKHPVRVVQETRWSSGLVWRERKISSLLGFDPQTVQPVASPYTD
jgi:hypothetical protein